MESESEAEEGEKEEDDEQEDEYEEVTLFSSFILPKDSKRASDSSPENYIHLMFFKTAHNACIININNHWLFIIGLFC